MTERAREIGLTKSVFGNSNGLPHPDSKVTMKDLVTLARHIQTTYPEFYRYYSQKDFTWNKILQRNRNPLLGLDIGVDGMKTGFTEESGYGIVASITWNDLALSLFPQQGLPAGDGRPTTPARIDPTDIPGIYKQLWGSRFFAGSIAGSQGTSAPPATSTTSTTPADLLCGRFDLSLCHGLTAAAETGGAVFSPSNMRTK